MGSRWIKTAVMVVGVVCSVGSGVDAEEKKVVGGNGEREMKLYNCYKAILETGLGVQEDCTPDANYIGPSTLVGYAGLTPIEMYRVFAAPHMGGWNTRPANPTMLGMLFDKHMGKWQSHKDKKDRCKMSEELICKDNKCTACTDPAVSSTGDCNAVKVIANATMAEATTSPPKEGGDPGKDVKSVSGISVSPVDGILLAGLVAAVFSLFV